jgi:hypothetical protein
LLHADLCAVGQSAGAREEAKWPILAETLPLFHQALPSDSRHINKMNELKEIRYENRQRPH